MTAILFSLVLALIFAVPAHAATGAANCTIAQRNGDYNFCYNDHVTVFGKPKQNLYLQAQNSGTLVIVYLKGKPANQLSSPIWLDPGATTLVYTNATGSKKTVEFKVARGDGGPAPLNVTLKWCTISGSQPCSP